MASSSRTLLCTAAQQPALRALQARRASARPRLRFAARAAASTGAPDEGPFQGYYGPWTITPADKAEVFAYRAALNVVAASFGLGTVAALAPSDAAWAASLHDQGSLLAAAGLSGMGAATALIHIYVAPLKRALQLMLGAGAAGAVVLASQHPGVPLPDVVAADPGAVWLVGPAFAALTGICFKEGVCYGKLESFTLFLLLPALLLGHLTGLVPEGGERALAGVAAALLALFAGRKWTQPIKDDIGDKSVFEFAALDEEGQREKLEEYRRQVADVEED